jgi:hypothetical protein
MSGPIEIAERVLAQVGTRAEAEVSVTSRNLALTRFANSSSIRTLQRTAKRSCSG